MASQTDASGSAGVGPFREQWLAHAVLTNLPAAVWIKDVDGRYLGCNAAFEEQFGVAEAEILGRVDTDFIDADQAALFRRQDLLALRSEAPVTNVESVVRSEDGAERLWETTKSVLRDRDGRVIGIFGIGYDVTGRAHTHREAVSWRRSLEEAQQVAHVGSWERDLSTGVVTWSTETFRIFGQSPATFVPTTEGFVSRVHPDDRPMVMAAMQHSDATGSPFAVEHRIVVGDEVKHVENRGRFVIDPAGRAVRIHGTIQDITDRVRDARRIQSFYHLVDRAFDAIVLVEVSTGLVAEVNGKAVAALRSTRERVVGTPIWDLIEQISAPWWRTVLGSAEFAPRRPIRYDVRRSDGTTFPADVSVELVEEEGVRYVLAVARDVTDRVEHERLLVESSEQYRALISGSSDGFWLADANGRIVDVNDAACRQSGYTRHELVGMLIGDLDVADSRDDVRARIGHILANGGQVFQTVHRRKDGSTWPAEVSVTHAPMQGGLMFGFIRDLTERHRADEELRLAARRWRALLDGSPDGFVRLDRSHRIVEVNDRYCELVGRSRDELLGRAILDLEVGDVEIEGSFSADRPTRSMTMKTVLHHRDGTPIPVEISMTRSVGEDGELYGFVHDVSEHVRLRAEVEASAKRFDEVMSASQDGFLVVDEAGDVVEVNDRYLELSGFQRDELIGTAIGDLDAQLSPSEIESIMARIREGRSGLFETRHRRKDGSTWPVENAVTFTDLDGGLYLSFVRDIRDRLAVQRSERKAADRYRSLLTGSGDGFARIDLTGTVLEANERLGELVGCPASELVGRSIADIDAQHDPGDIARHSQQLRDRGSDILETLLARADGTVVPVEINLTFVDTDGGQVLGFVRDVSDRVDAERTIRAAAEQHQALLDGSNDGFARLGLDGTILEVNQRLADMLQTTTDDLIGASVADIDTQLDQDAISFVASTVPESGSATWRSQVVRADGAELPVEVSITYSPQDGGQFLTFSRDISDRVQAEQTIREASERHAALLSGTTDGYVMTDLDGRIFDVNEEFCRQTGYTADELLGTAASWLDASGDHQSHERIVTQLREHGAGVYTADMRRKDGTLWPAEVSLTYWDTEGGRIFAFLRDITDRRAAEERIEFLAYHDPLTELPNRQQFTSRLTQIMERAEPDSMIAVCLFDLDGFKPVNDRYGHEAGDALLIKLGRRLRQLVGRSDTVARLGGDEFVVVFTDVTSLEHASESAAQLLDTIAAPFDVEGHRIQLSASIGVTIFPDDDHDADTMLRHADHAMYEAKKRGKGTYAIFDPSEATLAERRRLAFSELEAALDRDELVLHFQPRIELGSAQVVGVESLVRWQHPVRGLLLPGAFLPLIEATPLEIALDEWVMRAAIRQLHDWLEAGLDLSVSINISPRHFSQRRFPDKLASMLAEYPPDVGQHLELEVLETSAIGQVAEVADVMRRCAELGVTFSLDDFGTGYSSLTYFHSLPVSVLKIDQDFVRDVLRNPQDLDIVEGVVQLARALHRPVVAEGVETIEVGMLLHRIGCQYAQGFGIARPMPAAEVPAWMQRFRGEGPWRTLGSTVDRLGAAFDLDIAMVVHRRWIDELLATVAAGTPDLPLVAQSESCPAALWYRTAAAEGTDGPAWSSLEAQHEQLHELAESLVRHAPVHGVRPEDVEALRVASETFITSLRGVQDDWTAAPTA